MTYYYKIVDENGKLVMIGTQSSPVAPNKIGNEAITEEEYNALMDEIKSHAFNVQDYVNKVRAGVITLEDVPVNYRAEVESIINAPASEEPNNPYGIDNALYSQIEQGLVNKIVEEVSGNEQATATE